MSVVKVGWTQRRSFPCAARCFQVAVWLCEVPNEPDMVRLSQKTRRKPRARTRRYQHCVLEAPAPCRGSVAPVVRTELTERSPLLLRSQAAEQLTSSAIARVLHEMKDLNDKPAEGITVRRPAARAVGVPSCLSPFVNAHTAEPASQVHAQTRLSHLARSVSQTELALLASAATLMANTRALC